MQQPQISLEKIQAYERSHESLHLNRLIKFIEDKKSPSSNKLKHLLKKHDRLQSDRQLRRQSIEKELKLLQLQKMHNQSIAVNTKNIFVAKNKTQAASPRVLGSDLSRNHKILMSKINFQKLFEIQKRDFLPTELKKKINSKRNKFEQAGRTNLFPHLATPRTKRPMQFEKYEDETTRFLNEEMKNVSHSNKSKKAKSFQRSSSRQTRKDKKLIIENLQKQRQRFNESLQRLIQKALKDQSKHVCSNQNSIKFIEKIDRCGKSIDSGEQKIKGSEILYAEKSLLYKPNIKIKQNLKNRSTRKTACQSKHSKPVTMRNPESEPTSIQKQKQVTNSTNKIESRKRIIHTNREAYYVEQSLKLKTEILSNSKTEKKKQIFDQLIKKMQNHSIGEKITKLQRKSTNERKRISQKTKTMQSEGVNIKTLTKWEIIEHDWPYLQQDQQQNDEIQKYVQNLAKKSAKKTFYKRPSQLKTKFNFNDFEFPNVTSQKKQIEIEKIPSSQINPNQQKLKSNIFYFINKVQGQIQKV